MPNHVTAICTVTGPHADVLAFAERHIVLDDRGARCFGLGTVIPKPTLLDDITSGSETELGLSALVGEIVWTDFTRFRYLSPEVLAGPPFQHACQVRAWLEKNNPHILELGRKAARAIAETGYPTWYEWSIANWGTKWDAYAYEDRERGDGHFVFKFETAWSFPEPIFRKLAEMYPQLVFAIIAYDEGGNFACKGEFNGRNDYYCDKALVTDDMHERVYGYKPKRGKN